MGTGTLTSRSDGEKIPASDHNELVEALVGDYVPRNPSRAPQDIIGQLGTSVYRFLRAYIKEYFIGASANNLKIHEGATGEIWIENPNNDRIKIKDGSIELISNNVVRFRVNDSGIDWTVSSIPISALPVTTNYTGTKSGTIVSTGTVDSTTINTTINRNYMMIVSYDSIRGAAGETSVVSFKVASGVVKSWDFDGGATDVDYDYNTLTWVYKATSSGNKLFELFFDIDTTGQAFGFHLQIVEL